jgi:hypothetical protein
MWRGKPTGLAGRSLVFILLIYNVGVNQPICELMRSVHGWRGPIRAARLTLLHKTVAVPI